MPTRREERRRRSRESRTGPPRSVPRRAGTRSTTPLRRQYRSDDMRPSRPRARRTRSEVTGGRAASGRRPRPSRRGRPATRIGWKWSPKRLSYPRIVLAGASKALRCHDGLAEDPQVERRRLEVHVAEDAVRAVEEREDPCDREGEENVRPREASGRRVRAGFGHSSSLGRCHRRRHHAPSRVPTHRTH